MVRAIYECKRTGLVFTSHVQVRFEHYGAKSLSGVQLVQHNNMLRTLLSASLIHIMCLMVITVQLP